MSKSKYKYFVDPNSREIDLKRFDDDLEANEPDFIKNNSGIMSQPYIIKVQNTTGSAINNVRVLGANANLLGTNLPGLPNNYGNSLGISITMGMEDITYPELLMQSQSQPFTVGLTYLTSSQATQVLTTYYVQYKDANGNIVRETSAPILDPYQNINNTIPIIKTYPVSGDTGLVINEIEANTTLSIYLFPTENISMRKQLAGLNPAAEFGNPDVMNKRFLSLSPQAALALKQK